MKKKIIKKKPKRLVVSNEVNSLKNQIANLTGQVTQLAQLMHAQNIQLHELKFARPPVEDIRVAKQKPLERDETLPKSGFDKTLEWTTNQVNNHLDSLSGMDLQDIVQSAITGEPIIERQPPTHPKGGTDGKMTDWLNTNIGTVNTQENIWDAIGQAQVIARDRNAARAIEAKEFTKEWTAAMKDCKTIQDAYKLADVDTAKTQTEIDKALGNK